MMKSYLFFSSYYASLLVAVLLTSTNIFCANAYSGRIKLHVKLMEGGKSSDLAGAEVQCWDEDSPDGDDRMTRVKRTDKRGRVMLYYKKKKKSTWYSPTRGWDNLGFNSNPDIYCRIKKPGVIYPFHTYTKSNQNQDRTADFRTVYVYPDRVTRGDPGHKNGCGASWMPSAVTKSVDFVTQQKDTCDIHDLCYESCIETMETCDNEFKAIGYSICNDINDNWATKKPCKAAVLAMYTAIRKFGKDAYEANRDC